MTNSRNRAHQEHQPQHQQLPRTIVDAFAGAFAQPPPADLVLPDIIQPLPEPQQPAMTANPDALMPPPICPTAVTTQPCRQPCRILSFAENTMLRFTISCRGIMVLHTRRTNRSRVINLRMLQPKISKGGLS